MLSMLDNTKSTASKIKPRRTANQTRRRNDHNANQVVGYLSVVICAIFFATLISRSFAQDDENSGLPDGSSEGSTKDNKTNPGGGDEFADDSVIWREGYIGHGTTHEQLGQAHWPAVEFTPYTSKTNYTKAPIRSDATMDIVFNFSRFVFDTIVTDTPALPPGYVVMKDNDTLALGSKSEEDDWADLMAKYWLVFVWIVLLLIVIIVVPFIAVCYCCFCCCRRCKQGCPPCDERQDYRRRLCCGICLAVLIFLLLLALLIAFFSNRLLDRGLQDSSDTIRRGSEDTCLFMKDVADNIHHLLVLNYEELENHMIDQLNDAHKHLFLDLADTSESNAVTELERILDNMPEALQIMRQVDKLEKELRYTGSQLRDGVRGMKRDINYAASNLCGTDHCMRMVNNMDVEFIDTTTCLHFDELPNTTIYVESIESIIKKKHYEVPKRALQRLLEVNAMVQKQMEHLIPPLIRDVKKGSDAFREQSNKIHNIVNSVLSDIHQNTLHSTKSFEDVYERFGTGRDLVNLLVCLSLFLIIVILIVSLICGVMGSAHSTGGFCSRGTGAMCLLIVILLIFCVVSFIILVGTFYFMMGLITYEGACASLRNKEENSLRQLDSTMYRTPSHDDEDQTEVPAFRLSKAVKACTANRTIFDILRENHMYDINDLSRLKVLNLDDSSEHHIFEDDLSKFVILTSTERSQINKMRNDNLSTYHSTRYTASMCSTFTPMSLSNLAGSLRQLSYELSSEYDSAVYAFYNEHLTAKAYHEAYSDELKSIHSSLVQKLNKIDELIFV
ncbi:prominin-like protein [Drosophila tropicalis]|uniref:prominin-like protein n=1 Tax=Drosophila tropicalis TaxID=46794 RepID=UPI0035ABD226